MTPMPFPLALTLKILLRLLLSFLPATFKLWSEIFKLLCHSNGLSAPSFSACYLILDWKHVGTERKAWRANTSGIMAHCFLLLEQIVIQISSASVSSAPPLFPLTCRHMTEVQHNSYFNADAHTHTASASVSPSALQQSHRRQCSSATLVITYSVKIMYQPLT